MKRFVLSVVLVVLLPVELYLCISLLPTRWQNAVDQALCRVLPHDYCVSTHPVLDREIEVTLQQLPWLRFVSDAFSVVLLALNTFLLIRTWKALRAGPRRKQLLTDQNL